tara:strand:+ start:1518 stop:2423 length:906 start_codon:yes stop_codon:yes gene_type:complete
MKVRESQPAPVISRELESSGSKIEPKKITRRMDKFVRDGFVKRTKESKHRGKTFYTITEEKSSGVQLIWNLFHSMKNEGRKIRECWPHVAFEILGTEWFREKIDREWVKKELLQKNKDIEDWGDLVSHLEFDHALHLCLHSSPSALLRFLEVDSFSRSPTHYRGKGVLLGLPDGSIADLKKPGWHTIFTFLGNSDELSNYFHSMIFDIITDLHLHREHGASPFKQDSKPFIHMVDISPQQSKNHPGKSMIRIWPENGRVLHLETATSYSTSMQTEWNCYWFGSQEKENRSKFSLFQVLTDE